MKYTELACTLGTWGAPPPTARQQISTINSIAQWAKKQGQSVAIELYAERPDDAEALAHALSLKPGFARPLVFMPNPRTDRLKALASQGVQHIAFSVPVSLERASRRFKPDGIYRSIEYAALHAREAALLGLHVEIILEDITRSDKSVVSALIEAVDKELRPRGKEASFRLVDSIGNGDPLPGARGRTSLAGWVRWLKKEYDFSDDQLSVQASDQLGMGLANTLSAVKAGCSFASSLFGLGQGAGWAASELVLFHLFGENARLKKLVRLKNWLDPHQRRDSYRPLSGHNTWEAPAGTTPDNMSPKSEAQFGIDPHKQFGLLIQPLLTDLSGHAGMLYLMHHNNPDIHFPSDNQQTMDLSADFEKKFAQGRHQPISWLELEPPVRATGIIDRLRADLEKTSDK